MINSARFDPKTLATVKPGINGSLAEISRQIEQYLNAPAENVASLEAAYDEFHRMLGVLKMVGLDGLVVFCTEFERALGELKANPKQVSNMYRDVLRRALFSVTHFLDALADGADNAPLRLFPQYQELQQLRGLEMAFELDLFYPNLDVQLPQQILKPPRQEGVQARLKVLRGQYQQGLLRWLRQEDAPAALLTMQQTVGGVMFCEPQDNSRVFWWISYCLLECLKLDGLPAEMNARKLLGRIDQQMRLLAEGEAGSFIETRSAMNEMLFMIGRSHAESEQVKAIRQVFSLDKYLPEVSTMQIGELDQQLDVMRDQLRVAEESWDLCVQGDSAACEKFSKYVELIKQQSEKFDRDTLQYLASQIQTLSHYATTPEHARPIALDMAMALLLLGSGIENYSRLGSGFQEQAHILSERMQAAIKQQPEDEKQLTELIDLNYQMDQQGDVMGSLANEMLVNLQHVEEGLNGFFNNPAKREDLAELLRLLGQIQGGLRITSLKHAEKVLMAIQKNVRRFAQSNTPPRPAERYAIADAMSALENYMQHLAHGQTGNVARLLAASADMDNLDKPPAPDAPPVPAKQTQITAPVAPIKVEQPPSPAAPVKVVQPPVPVVPAVAEQTQAPEQVAPAAAEQPQAPEPVAPVIVELPQVPESATPAAAEQPAVAAEIQPLSEEEQELLDIFLEEAQEVLRTIHTNREICRSHPVNHEALVTIRRGFHTLKGSGRMVGLTDLGEVAWCVERAMNKWLQEKKPATPELLKFISEAEQSFSVWVEMLKKQGTATIEANKLIADAQQIENGIDLETAEIPAEQPAQGSASEPEPAPDQEIASETEQGSEQMQALGLEPVATPMLAPETELAPEAEREPEQMPALDFEMTATQMPAPEPEVEPEQAVEQMPALDFEMETVQMLAPEPAPEVEPELVPEQIPALDFGVDTAQILAPAPETEPEQVPEQIPVLDFELETAQMLAPEPAPEVEPELAPEQIPALDFEMAATRVLAPEPVPEVEQEPEQAPEQIPAFDFGLATPPAIETASAQEEEAVVIGDITMPQDLFEIASLEAMQNVDTLHQQYKQMCMEASPKVQHDFMRAAHTLGGVCRTMGFGAVVNLAQALEEWLWEHVEHPSRLNNEQMKMLEQSISALNEMVQSICELRMPEMRGDLANQLMADKSKSRGGSPEPEIAPSEAQLQQESGGEQLLAEIGKISEAPADSTPET
ncbi:MAG: Hpt domain-containing protein, partial [Gallionella sp.]|nr:Hpt domain-containing protein [Gallionella sp.]